MHPGPIADMPIVKPHIVSPIYQFDNKKSRVYTRLFSFLCPRQPCTRNSPQSPQTGTLCPDTKEFFAK
jgi:hypothetical protein